MCPSTDADNPIVTCTFCRASLPLDAAITAGWEPGYFPTLTALQSQNVREFLAEPVCASCVPARLAIGDDDGNLYLKAT